MPILSGVPMEHVPTGFFFSIFSSEKQENNISLFVLISAWLIAQNGTITLSQNWFNPEQMREAINQLLGENLK